jgi:hypothetical protein
MKSIMFTFGENSTEAGQDRLQAEIATLPGVRNVGRISPEAKKPSLRRMWYAEVDDEAVAHNLVARLRSHGDIQSAEMPAERGLV